MALKAGRYGLKKKMLEKLLSLPGIKSIGDGLSLNAITGELSATGGGGGGTTVVANPEGEATSDLNKLQVGSDIYNIPDTTYSEATTSEAGLMSATDKEKLDGLKDVIGNPTGTAAAGDLTALQIGNDIFNIPDTTYSEATSSAAGLMSANDKKVVDGLRVADGGKKTFLYSNILSNAINKGFDLVCPAYRVIFLIFGANGGAYSGIVVLLRNGTTSANAYLMANSSNVSMADVNVALNDNSDGIKVSFPSWSGGVQYTIIGSSFGTSDASVTNDITVAP